MVYLFLNLSSILVNICINLLLQGRGFGGREGLPDFPVSRGPLIMFMDPADLNVHQIGGYVSPAVRESLR